MSEEKEAFLSRWSRLKRAQSTPEKRPDAPAPALPPVEKLDKDSDFAGFMQPAVQDALRRVALKKLFTDPHFNIPDPFEPYSIDLTVAESIPPEMLEKLNQARTVLFREEEEKKKAEEAAQADQQESNERESKQDEPGRQDT